jgi:hypothetical protein
MKSRGYFILLWERLLAAIEAKAHNDAKFK